MRSIFGREPAVWITVISAALSTLVAFGLTGLTDVQTAAIVAFLNALAAIWIAFATRPISPAVFSGAAAAAAVLLGSFGFDLSQQQIGAVNVLILGVFALITRQQISPAGSVAPEVLGRPAAGKYVAR